MHIESILCGALPKTILLERLSPCLKQNVVECSLSCRDSTVTSISLSLGELSVEDEFLLAVPGALELDTAIRIELRD